MDKMTRSDVLLEVARYEHGILSKKEESQLIHAMHNKLEDIWKVVFVMEEKFPELKDLAAMMRKALES